METSSIIFLIFVFIIIVLLIMILVFSITNNNSDSNSNSNSNSNNTNYPNNYILGIMDFLKKDLSKENIYYTVSDEKNSQESLNTLSVLFYFNVYFNNPVNMSFIKTFNDNYNKTTSNWYTQNIGISKYFIYGIYLDRKNIFKSNNENNINLIISLLDKIFNTEQNIRDELTNGINVIAYNLVYIQLQKEYSQYLKIYSCHKNNTYMNKCYDIINQDFIKKDKFDENGFYIDNSYIYHTNGPNTFGYLYSTLEDYAFLIKHNIYKVNDKNTQTILDCFEPFIYNNISFYNVYGRGISRKRVKRFLYMTFLYLNELKSDFVNKNSFDVVEYENLKINKNFLKENKNYLLPMSGLYLSYGKEKYDNYYISSLIKNLSIETVYNINDGDLFNLNINLKFNFLFGDDDLNIILRNYNHVKTDLANIILSGALLLKNYVINDTNGWITTFNHNIKNIEIVLTYTDNFVFIFIIDRRNNIMSVVFYPFKVNKEIIQICGMSLYSKYDLYGGLNEEKNCIQTISDLKTRYLYSDLTKEIVESNALSTLSYYYVLLTIDYNNVNKNIFYVTNNDNHKLPTIENTNNYIKYTNGVESFTLRKNIKKEEFNIVSEKDYDVDKMFLLESNNDKILQYFNYPYYSTTPASASGKNFTMDNNYRYYINL